MDNLAETNDFIDKFEKLYDEVYMKKNPIEIASISKTKKSFFKKEKTEIVYEINDDIDKVYREIKIYLDNILSKQAQDFWTLWRYCQFVRWAEKVFLYKNSINEEGLIYVDSEMTSNEREFVFKFGEGVSVYFKLELLQKNYVKITESAYNEVLTILVTRDYGKKMENKIIVVNGETDLENDSDIYMINGLNMYLNRAIRLTTNEILKNILGEKIYEKVVHIDNGYYPI